MNFPLTIMDCLIHTHGFGWEIIAKMSGKQSVIWTKWKNWWMAGRCSSIRTRKSGCELKKNQEWRRETELHRYPWTPPPHQTHRQSYKMHTQPYMPPPPELLPWESVPKQLTVRQVHEHGGTPTETGQDLTEQTSQRTSTPLNPLPTKAHIAHWPVHTTLWSRSTSHYQTHLQLTLILLSLSHILLVRCTTGHIWH